MNDLIKKKIIAINLISFFFIWLLIFLAGADKPPPIGFLWLVGLLIALDIVLFFYLKSFLPRLKLRKKGIFFIHMVYFFVGGIVLSLVTILLKPSYLDVGLLNISFWTISIVCVSMINGICCYLFNLILLRLFEQQ
ncbi:hypothetical protein KM914_04025 [Virgibacillus pantothenticus]|uniref:hypothetical protein n=1 Tax=Virgibacillus pantothenticus TaxID=1473 RepID=UPI001C213C89|nr:hypothetical protein [Virgibacillus pantothenticus]MBU8565612.1 hypothetical protein [Virgibacillus pantothenticus]MBU8601306.1 hypothetical protein [Virgibacillus pantothenticus]MBU8635656.1 hypothetical protein [Virgibacillus pantothenticus]MBU8643349.1 hypothetical protein [Virgibacillus pantothenticus]MBU8647404.1 hypothetical protein [Virgibacillus pantothenticus]